MAKNLDKEVYVLIIKDKYRTQDFSDLSPFSLQNHKMIQKTNKKYKCTGATTNIILYLS